MPIYVRRPNFHLGIAGPPAGLPPAAPVLSTAVPTSETVTVTWTTPADNGSAITGYQPRFRVPPSGAWVTDSIAAGVNTKLWFLLPGSYEFQVAAINARGQSSWSNSLYATVSVEGPPPTDDRQWFEDLTPAYVAPTPVGSGVTRTVTTWAEFTAARTAAGPGDVININGTITGNNQSNACIRWDDTHPQGTAAAPITITCGASGIINRNDNTSSNTVGFDLLRTTHVHVVGCDIRNAQFGFRAVGAIGASGSPIKIHHNKIRGCREACLYVGSLSTTRFSTHVSVMYNHTHLSTRTSDFNEGIYIGTGSTSFEWQDRSNNIEIAYNLVEGHRGDGIDMKPGIWNIKVHHNVVRNCGTTFGSGIGFGAGGPMNTLNPLPSFNPAVEIYSNWVYNIGYVAATRPGLYPSQSTGATHNPGSSYGILCNIQGTKIYNNIVWAMDPSNTNNVRGIAMMFYQNHGTTHPIDVFNNTIWVSGSSIHNTINGGAAPTRTFRNNLTADGAQGTTVVAAGAFVGTVPPLNPTSATTDADSGAGIGSAFVLAGGNGNINAATGVVPSVDITGIVRPQGPSSDRGAFEVIP